MKHQRTIEKEIRVPKFIRNKNGCEVTSDDGKLRLILQKTVAMTDDAEHCFYTLLYYIKENNTWTKTNTTASYQSVKELMEDIGRCGEFHEAYSDYQSDKA